MGILGSGLIIGVLMLGYTPLLQRVAEAVGAPDHAGQHGCVMLAFWALFQTSADWVSVAFYIWG